MRSPWSGVVARSSAPLHEMFCGPFGRGKNGTITEVNRVRLFGDIYLEFVGEMWLFVAIRVDVFFVTLYLGLFVFRFPFFLVIGFSFSLCSLVETDFLLLVVIVFLLLLIGLSLLSYRLISVAPVRGIANRPKANQGKSNTKIKLKNRNQIIRQNQNTNYGFPLLRRPGAKAVNNHRHWL